MVEDVRARTELFSAFDLFLGEALADLQGGFDLRRLGETDAFDRADLLNARFLKLAERLAEQIEQLASVIERTLTRTRVPDAQDDCQQLCVRKRVRPLLHKLFPRSVRLRPLPDWLRHGSGSYHTRSPGVQSQASETLPGRSTIA